MAKLSLCAQLHIVKKGSTFLNFKLQKFHSAFTQKEQISPILSSTAIAIMEKFHQNVSIWSLWQRQLYCFLKTMHLEESWSIDIEALLCSKFWLGIVLAFCLHVTVLPSSSRATVSHSSDNRQNFFCFQLFIIFLEFTFTTFLVILVKSILFLENTCQIQ